MKTLIVFYSFTGNNEIVARELQERLRCDLVRIETTKKRTKFSIFIDFLFHREPTIRELGLSLTQYDRFVILGPVWAGRIASPLKTFLRKYKDAVKHYAFLTVCGGGQSEQKSKIKSELCQLLGIQPTTIAELWINNIVPAAKRNTLAVSEYRMGKEDVNSFSDELYDFIQALSIESPSVKRTNIVKEF